MNEPHPSHGCLRLSHDYATGKIRVEVGQGRWTSHSSSAMRSRIVGGLLEPAQFYRFLQGGGIPLRIDNLNDAPIPTEQTPELEEMLPLKAVHSLHAGLAVRLHELRSGIEKIRQQAETVLQSGGKNKTELKALRSMTYDMVSSINGPSLGNAFTLLDNELSMAITNVTKIIQARLDLVESQKKEA